MAGLILDLVTVSQWRSEVCMGTEERNSGVKLAI